MHPKETLFLMRRHMWTWSAFHGLCTQRSRVISADTVRGGVISSGRLAPVAAHNICGCCLQLFRAGCVHRQPPARPWRASPAAEPGGCTRAASRSAGWSWARWASRVRCCCTEPGSARSMRGCSPPPRSPSPSPRCHRRGASSRRTPAGWRSCAPDTTPCTPETRWSWRSRAGSLFPRCCSRRAGLPLSSPAQSHSSPATFPCDTARSGRDPAHTRSLQPANQSRKHILLLLLPLWCCGIYIGLTKANCRPPQLASWFLLQPQTLCHRYIMLNSRHIL